MKDYVDRGRVAGVVTLDRSPWQGGAPPELRQPRYREERADAEGLDLPHRVDVEGRHEHRRAHPARGGQAAALRSRLEVHPGLQEHDGRRPATGRRGAEQPRRGRPRQARNHDSGSAHAHLRRVVRQRPRRGAVQGCQHLDVVLRRQGRADPARDRAARLAAVRCAAGREIHLRLQHRHPRGGRREGIGHAARRVLPRLASSSR